MMEKELKVLLITVVVCVLLAVISIFVLAPRYEKLETYEPLTKNLDSKREKVVNMSALLFGTSTAIAMIPGDATTPVANEIAHMNTYLVWVLGAITLEKFLLPLIGMLTFRVLFPLTLFCFCLYRFKPKLFLRNVSVLLLVISIVFPAMIPASIAVGNRIDRSFGTDILLDRITEDLEELKAETGQNKKTVEGKAETNTPDKEQAPSLRESITGFTKDIVENTGEKLGKIKDNVVSASSDLSSRAKIIAGNAIEAIAALVISSCVIPIGVILLMVWILRMSVSVIFVSLGNSVSPMVTGPLKEKDAGMRKDDK